MSAALMGWLVVLSTPSSLFAQTQGLEGTFAEANQEAYAGKFDQAVERYRKLIDAGVEDADVYFNLGVSYAKTERLGHAIAAFERALIIDPEDTEARTHLERAQSSLGSIRAETEGEVEIASLPFPETLAGPFTERGLAMALLVLSWLLLVAAILVWKSATPRWLTATFASLCLIAFAATGFLLAAKDGAFRRGELAIVVAPTTPLREGPDARAKVRTDAKEGDRGEVLETDGTFALVQLRDGRRGWVERETIVQLTVQ